MRFAAILRRVRTCYQKPGLPKELLCSTTEDSEWTPGFPAPTQQCPTRQEIRSVNERMRMMNPMIGTVAQMYRISQHTSDKKARDKRIFSTGCSSKLPPNRLPNPRIYGSLLGAAEQTSLNDCFYEKKDWRLCKNEVRLGL